KLLQRRNQTSGRNNQGKITIRHRGGGNRKHFRVIDFNYQIFNIPAKVLSLEYDPNRSAHIALVKYQSRQKRYIIAQEDLKVGSQVIVSKKTKIASGNRCQLRNIPIGTGVYNIELLPNKGSKLVRSAGTLAVVLAKEADFAHLK